MSRDDENMTPMASVMNSMPRHVHSRSCVDEARFDIKCQLEYCGCPGDLAKRIVDGMTDDAVIKVRRESNLDNIKKVYNQRFRS